MQKNTAAKKTDATKVGNRSRNKGTHEHTSRSTTHYDTTDAVVYPSKSARLIETVIRL